VVFRRRSERRGSDRDGRGAGAPWLRSRITARVAEVGGVTLRGAVTDVSDRHRVATVAADAAGHPSRRQLEILQLVAEGATAAEIGGASSSAAAPRTSPG
jgi:DNA-binding NarL/FixJ family response regulator